MSKTTECLKILAVVILVLLTIGIGSYFIPRFAQVLNGSPISWNIQTKDEKVVLSSFEEQSFLQQVYAEKIKQDILDSVGRIVGKDSVQVSVRIQLDLEKQKNTITKTTKNAYTEEIINRTGGILKKISVSVLIDGQTEKGKNNQNIYHPRKKEDVKKIEGLVKGIIGFQADRGDNVEVLNMPFSQKTKSLWGVSASIWLNGALLLFAFFFVMVVFVGLILPLIKSMFPVKTRFNQKDNLLKKAMSLCRQDVQRAVSIFKNVLRENQKRKNPRVYTVLEQSAIVLLSLGNNLVKEIFSYLNEEEIRTYGKVMACLGRVSDTDIRQSLNGFIHQFYTPSALIGSPESVKEILATTRRDGKRLYSEIYLSADGKNIWEQLALLDKGTLVLFLKKRNPETIAFILYHLPEKIAGKVLILLPKETASRILIHLKHIPAIRSEIREKITGEIATDLCRLLERGRQPDKTTDILKTLSREIQDNLVSEVALQDKETACKIISGLREWSDVLILSEDKIKQLLKYIDKNVLALALVDRSITEQTVFARLLPPAMWQQIGLLIQKKTGQNGQAARNIILKTACELGLF